MLQCLLGWARWLAVKGAALALGIPLGLALGVGAVLRWVGLCLPVCTL